MRLHYIMLHALTRLIYIDRYDLRIPIFAMLLLLSIFARTVFSFKILCHFKVACMRAMHVSAVQKSCYTFFYKQPSCLGLTRKICPKIKQLA